MAGKIGPALAMGNTVVVKPAPQDPLGVIRLAEVFQEAGFPPGVVNVIVGSSAGVGRGAGRVAARRHGQLHRQHGRRQRIGEVARPATEAPAMELGGKGASLVFDGADLDRPLAGIASTFTSTPGQICTAPTRLIAQRGVYDQIVEKLAGIARP